MARRAIAVDAADASAGGGGGGGGSAALVWHIHHADDEDGRTGRASDALTTAGAGAVFEHVFEHNGRHKVRLTLLVDAVLAADAAAAAAADAAAAAGGGGGEAAAAAAARGGGGSGGGSATAPAAAWAESESAWAAADGEVADGAGGGPSAPSLPSRGAAADDDAAAAAAVTGAAPVALAGDIGEDASRRRSSLRARRCASTCGARCARASSVDRERFFDALEADLQDRVRGGHARVRRRLPRDRVARARAPAGAASHECDHWHARTRAS